MSFTDELSKQLLEAQVETLRSGGFKSFKTGDSEIDAATEGGMGIMSTNDDRKTIYDTATGEPRDIPLTMLAKTLAKKRDGRPAFSLAPVREFVRGNVMCYLHPDHPDYPELAKIGLGGKVCGGGETNPAAHLASEFDRDLHMQHRHSREWAVLKEHRARMEREEDRRLRREEIEAMKSMAGRRGA